MNSKIITIIVAGVVAVIGAFILSRVIFRNDFNLPRNGEAQKEIIMIQDNGVEVEKEIMITNERGKSFIFFRIL